MATDVERSCYGWSHEELDEQDDSREISVSQMLDHGSISFGRFALEPLSWEKKSAFTRNRYQEELEKFKAPGLVAQKKAYFEEYYKRIRAMKALQENQHTEPASNCSDSSGISGQIREEDQRVVPSESDGDEMIKTNGPDVEKASTEVTLDVDGETALVEFDSPAKFSKENKNGESSPISKHCQILDLNSCHLESITTSIADSEQPDFIRVDNKLEPRGIISESISRQTGAENQRIIGKNSHGDELEYIISSDREKASFEVPLGIDVETDPSAKSSKHNKMGENSRNSKRFHFLDQNSCDHEPITAIIDVPLGIDVETDPSVTSSKDNNMGENSQNSKQFQFLDQNSCDHEPITASIEDRKQRDFISQDNEEISKKSEKHAPNYSFYSSSAPKVLEDKLNAEQKKVNQAVKGFKDHARTSEVMEHSSTAGDLVTSELKTKSVTVMLTQVLGDSSQKRNGKNYVCVVSHKQTVVSHKQTVDRLLSSKHPTVASHGSNKEMHSKVTTPRPFSFATGKQAVASISASARYDTKNILSSSALPPKNINSKGVSSRPGILHSQKGEKPENRRGHEPRRQPLVTNRQATHLKGGSASNVIRPLKARSVNLPNSCKGVVNVGANSNRFARKNEEGKRKLVEVAKDDTCLNEVRAHGKSTIFKMAPSRSRDFSVNMKNSLLGDNSHDRRKPRLEKPRWR